MMALRSFFIFVCVILCVRGNTLFKPCLKDDIVCLRAATQSFLSQTFGGYQKLGIKPIDPLIVPSVDLNADDDLGLVLHFKNVNITGLRNLEIADFKLDTDKHLGLLKMKVDVSIVADIEIFLSKHNKNFKGVYTATAAIHGISEYSATLKTVNDKQYFDLGPETTYCEVLGEPTVSLGNDLQNSLDKDEQVSSLKSRYLPKQLTVRRKALCAIGDHGFATIIHNLRSVAKVFDKSAFFKDV